MTVVVTDPGLERRLIEDRKATGADCFDEVWEGVYMMAPFPNVEHQSIVAGLTTALHETIVGPGLGIVLAGVNISDRGDDWEHDYRVPDVAVFLRNNPGENLDTHWRGPADLLIEVTSPGDRTREKLPFYGRLGVAELLIVERRPWRLELHRGQDGQMVEVARCDASTGAALSLRAAPLTLRLVESKPRPQIEVTQTETGRSWMV